jgi:[acyl-carrier-protein] S-malonyltransferase
MRGASQGLAERLLGLDLQLPAVPVLHNVDFSEAGDLDGLRGRLVDQLYRPVRWVETVQAIAARGIDQAIECGPGKVLTGLNKRIVTNLTTLPVYDPQTLESALEVIGHA